MIHGVLVFQRSVSAIMQLAHLWHARVEHSSPMQTWSLQWSCAKQWVQGNGTPHSQPAGIV